MEIGNWKWKMKQLKHETWEMKKKKSGKWEMEIGDGEWKW